MEDKEAVMLNKEQVFELDQIILDKDEKAALKFLEQNIYRPIQKRKDSGCKPKI